MIILDTNVISELMREVPDASVANWVQQIEGKNFALTVITIAEILRGIERLPKGRRRQKLEQNFQAFIQAGFSGRLLSFDEPAALLYGKLAACREKAGFTVDPVDLMIASIAQQHHASIATRNTKDFEGCGLILINPWQTMIVPRSSSKRGQP